jgi:hypothetical protein
MARRTLAANAPSAAQIKDDGSSHRPSIFHSLTDAFSYFFDARGIKLLAIRSVVVRSGDFFNGSPKMRFAALVCLLLAITACGGNAKMNTVSPPADFGVSDSGSVHHANTPIAGARVYLLAANTTGYGDASVSLLNPTLTGASDAIGAYVTTAADGSFSMKGDYTCVPDSQVYMYALGGNSGSGDNNASGLLTVLGSCPASGNFTSDASVVINEVSTVAAANALAGFATDATHVSSSGTPLAQIGISNAFANAANLSDFSGTAPTTTPAGNGAVPQSQIYTLANLLAACVGTASPSATSICATLFVIATADGTATGTQPSDTATAAINIAHNPDSNIAALYSLAITNSFAPALASQPMNFTIALTFTYPNLLVPVTVGMAADG